MVTAFVLDCSLAISWFIQDEADASSDAVLAMLDRGQAIVPAIWPFEFTNTLVVAERRKRISSKDILRIMTQLRRLPIIVEGAPESKGWEAFVILAQEHGLSTYDAAYLELAIRLKLPLASKDAQLLKAARKMNLSLN